MSQPTRMKLSNLVSRIEILQSDVAHYEQNVLPNTVKPDVYAYNASTLANIKADLASHQAALPIVAAKRAARLQKEIDAALAK